MTGALPFDGAAGDEFEVADEAPLTPAAQREADRRSSAAAWFAHLRDVLAVAGKRSGGGAP